MQDLSPTSPESKTTQVDAKLQPNKAYKWEVLGLLWVAFFINQADRQVFNVVLPLIKADLALTDVQVGSIATVFNLVFALLVPLSGYVGDIYSRKWIIVVSILFWSVATMLTGLSSGVVMLILFRSVATGGGEAFFGPANYALLASYHKKTRAFAMSIHQTSYYLGIILSGYVAGYVGEHYGWRSAFYVFGAVGVIHGLILIFRLKDNKVSDQPVVKKKADFLVAVKVLLATPTAILLTVAFSGLIFVLVGYLTWAPTYLYEKFGMSLSEAGFHSMFYTHAFAFVGIILAGKFSDRLAIKDPGKRLVMQAVGLLGAVPFIIVMGNAESLLIIYIGFAGFGFARAFFDANTYSVLYDVIPAEYHSTVSGIMMMTGFSVGSISPMALGYLKPITGLAFGFTLLAAVWVVCGIVLLVAYRYYFKKDYENAHQS
ncbi:sugar phosphate permease [Dyadobacter jejuensis]|uniref:Sugar phosphate permease n=1 Tax=Dyadobacter jejuensis TaxID=1082580 RepID=A0A316A8U9_9BACT|nr:MFS transporter [Dyadobacter jejuensis]PWJ54063.1 sugar phosphate permease [Dyadobacter jejuensis]